MLLCMIMTHITDTVASTGYHMRLQPFGYSLFYYVQKHDTGPMHPIQLISTIRIVGPQSSLSFSLGRLQHHCAGAVHFLGFSNTLLSLTFINKNEFAVFLFIKSPHNTSVPLSGRVF